MPAGGAVLQATPAEIRLVFSNAMVARQTSLTLRSPDGKVIRLPQLASDPVHADRQFFTRPPLLEEPGRYHVDWRGMGADGRIVAGSFAFTLLPAGPAASRGPEAARQEDAAHGGLRVATPPPRPVDPETLPPLLRPGSWPSTTVRFSLYAAVLGLLGAATFLTLLLPGAGLMPTVQFRLALGARRFAAGSSLLLLLALAFRLWLQSVALHGPGPALRPPLLAGLLAAAPWGWAWLAQLAAAGLAGFAAIAGIRPLLALAAVALAATLPFQGHAATAEPWRALALAADALHVLGAGAWIGTLAVLVSSALPALFRDGPERGGHDTARLLAGFSPLALAAAALLAAAGTMSALLQLHSPVELLTTGWGRTLLLKLALFALVLAAGWYNWRRARPSLPAHTGVRALRRAATLELLLAAAVLAATAALAALPTP